MKLRFWRKEPEQGPTEVPPVELRDLIYFDFDRVSSIYSQLKGGLVKEIQDAIESSTQVKSGFGANAKVIKSRPLFGDRS